MVVAMVSQCGGVLGRILQRTPFSHADSSWPGGCRFTYRDPSLLEFSYAAGDRRNGMCAQVLGSGEVRRVVLPVFVMSHANCRSLRGGLLEGGEVPGCAPK